MLRPLPLPTETDVRAMPWWAPLGGIAGAVAVFGGLLFVDKVGAGPFNGLLITANLMTSLAIDHFGWFHMPEHRTGKGRSQVRRSWQSASHSSLSADAAVRRSPLVEKV